MERTRALAASLAASLAFAASAMAATAPQTDASRYARKDWATSAEKAGVRDRIRFQPFDAGAMPFAPETFDAVFFFGVLHHVDESARTAVVREALRVA
jgi:ubiquinone/menaquinone biosynthesis C-methylase UbiE